MVAIHGVVGMVLSVPHPPSPHSAGGLPHPAARTLALWGFCGVALLQAIAFVLQPISIGSFLQGSWVAFDLHQAVGGVLVIWTGFTAGVGVLLAILGRHVWLGIGVAVLCVLTVKPRGVV